MKRILVAAALVACGSQGQEQSSQSDPVLEPLASPAVTLAEHGSDGPAGYVGVLTPRSSAEVLAPSTSTVAEVVVKLGEHVDKGQTLGRLDERPLREELAIAQAALRAAQADMAQAAVAQRAARSVLERERRAFHDKIVAQAQVTAAEFDERKAAMAHDHSRASVAEQRARIARLNAKLADTTLVAPLAGKVALAYVQPGDRVTEGQPLVRLISSDELFVKFAIPADHAGTLSAGSVVDVLFGAQGIAARAVVRHVAPELDSVAQMIVADADLVAPPAQLQSGMMCRIVPVNRSAAVAPR